MELDGVVFPEPTQLFADPGTAHAEMLELFDRVRHELAAEGYIMPAEEFIRLSHRAWTVWSQFAPAA